MSRVLVVALALAGIAGCAGVGGQVSEEERRAYTRALAGRTTDPAAAESALVAFLSRHPQSALADDAGLTLGELAEARGDTDVALRRYLRVTRDYPRGDRVDSARVAAARIEHARERPEAALAALADARFSNLDDAEQREALRILIDVAEDPAERLRHLGALRELERDDDARSLVDVEIDRQLERMDRPDLERAADAIGRRVPAARALLAAAGQALDQGAFEAASDAVDRAERLPLAPAYHARLAAMRERVRLREAGALDVDELPSFADAAAMGSPAVGGAVGTLGAVLPLSGRFARFGEESLQGVLLAAGVFGDAAGAPRIRVLARDSAGDPARAAAAVRELAEQGVVAIVGPLLKGECDGAAAAAEEAGVPLIALTAREEVSTARPHVFRVRTQPEEEVATLVQHAVTDLGAQRFAILYPRDAYGLGQRELFWQSVEARGGRVVAVASYEPGITDFAKPIRRLVGYEFLTSGEKQALRERDELERRARRLPPEQASKLRAQARALTGPKGRPLPPIVDFDALFIPESYDQVVLIAPQLAFHEAVGATLLGPNGWYHPDLLRIGQRHVEGARFTAHFFAESEYPFVRDFADRYGRAYQESPDVFAAQAFDATNLVLAQLARGRETREAVREGVLAVRGWPGVTGVLTMRPDGSARKRPYLLSVDGGEIQQLR